MSIEELKQLADHVASVMVPKIFTVTATGNLLIAGLSAADVISAVTAFSSLIFLWVVSLITIRHKRRVAYLTELEIAKAEASQFGESKADENN